MSRPVKEWHSEWYKAKLCLWYICEFLRSREDDTTREWGTSIKEYRLIEFQQRLGERIPDEDIEEKYSKPFSTNENTLKSRRKREKLKEKIDYENLLKELRENAKKKS